MSSTSNRVNRRNFTATSPCEYGSDCVKWDPEVAWIDPGLLQQAVLLMSLPALAISVPIVRALGRSGVSEVRAFFICVPPLFVAWFYVLGSILDWSQRRLRAKDASQEFR